MQGDVWVMQTMDDDGATVGQLFDDIYKASEEVCAHEGDVSIRITRVTTHQIASHVFDEIDQATAEARS